MKFWIFTIVSGIITFLIINPIYKKLHENRVKVSSLVFWLVVIMVFALIEYILFHFGGWDPGPIPY